MSLIWRSGKTILLLVISYLLHTERLHGDAIVVTKAMSASTISEIFVENNTVRVELEIGSEDLSAFKNLLPNEIHDKLGFDPIPFEQRIDQFFNRDWVIRSDDGSPLAGQVSSFQVRKRIKRDEITGAPLAVQPEGAEIVVYAVLEFHLEGQPRSISIGGPTDIDQGRATANIGFITYHKGLPVSDFRYLAVEETLELDWQDPWYSRFRNPNLRRQYDSPVSVFVYVEPFEVRKEIVIRPVDLQRWVDLDVDVNATIPVADQAKLKQRIAEFVADKHPLTIDGRHVNGSVDRIHFIRRTLRKTGVVYPDEDLAAASATLGVIVVYPIERLPQQVSMTWQWFDDKITQIPASATDEAGGLPSMLTPDDPVLVWKNYLTNPTIPAMRSVPAPPQRGWFTLPLISIACVFAASFVVFGLVASKSNRMVLIACLFVLLVFGWMATPWANVTIANPLTAQTQITEAQAGAIMDSLLHNLYHAFDRRQESLVYDQLALSLSGHLLRDVYLQTRKRIELADQGGAQVKIDQVEIQSNAIQQMSDQSFVCKCQWFVSGTVGHWGHLHRRRMGYEAEFGIESIDDVWKIASMHITAETQPEVVVP